MYLMGDNPMVASPDTGTVEAGLRNLDFLVVQELFMSETAALADVVLPPPLSPRKTAPLQTPNGGSSSCGRLVEAPGQTRPDWQIVCEISTALGYPMT